MQGFYLVVGCVRQPALLRCAPSDGYRCSGVPFDDRTSFMNSSRTRQAPAILLASSGAPRSLAVDGVASATANPSIQSKRAQAQAILAQVHESDAQLEQAIEAYNYANVQLGQPRCRPQLERATPRRRPAEPGVAQVHVAERLRALYINGDGGGAVEILLGAQNLDDLLGRLDMVQRVGDQDAKVLGDVKQFRKEVTAAAGEARRALGPRRPGSWPSEQARSSRSPTSSPSASACSPASRPRSGSSRRRRRCVRPGSPPRPVPGWRLRRAPPRLLRRRSATAADDVSSAVDTG